MSQTGGCHVEICQSSQKIRDCRPSGQIFAELAQIEEERAAEGVDFFDKVRKAFGS